MHLLRLVLLFVAVQCISGERHKMSLRKTTTTVVTYLTTLSTCKFSTSCATTVGPVTECRRRRAQPSLDIDQIFPSKPVRVETTLAPIENEPKEPEIWSSNEPREVFVNGLESRCFDGRQFGVTLIYTSTLTLTETCLTSVTQTNTYTLAGCTPAGLVFCTAT